MEELPSGLDVVAVRLTLLDGSGAVIDLGHARLLIAGSRPEVALSGISQASPREPGRFGAPPGVESAG